MLVKLTHSSSVKGAEGEAGDIVNASDLQANHWLENGGAVELTPEEQAAIKPKRRVRTKADSSTDDSGSGSGDG